MSPKQRRQPSVSCKIIGFRDPLSVILIPDTNWFVVPQNIHCCRWSPKDFFDQLEVMDESDMLKNVERQHYFLMYADVPLSLIYAINPSWNQECGFSDVFINKFHLGG